MASTPTEGLLGDALIVGLGAWVISWAALVQPIADQTGTTAWSTVLYGMYQPTASVVLFLVVVVLLDQRHRPASMWLLAGALTFNLVGDLLYALIDAGHICRGDGTGGIADVHRRLLLCRRRLPAPHHHRA